MPQTAPHTLLSHKMVGPQQFKLMKKDSYFIAVSRGGLYFSIAYTATAQNVRKYCQGGKKIWQHK